MGLFLLNFWARWLTFPNPERLTVLRVITTRNLRWLNIRSLKNPSLHKVVDVMTVNSKDLVVNLNLSLGKGLRPLRSSYFVLSALSANVVNRCPSNVPSILSWEVTRNARDR